MADVPGKFFKATKVRTGVSPSSPGVIEGETLPPLNPPGGSLNSVGLSMPSAFNVANSPLTSNGTLAVTGAGTVGQYIRGDGSLADFPQASGGGSSVSYYLNGSVNQGTIGGVAYRELSKVPILGAGTDFTINADGYIASFITDAGDPNLLEIPGGNWNFETYFSASSSGGTPTFYVELYKVSGTTATLIASSSSAPELIAFGTNLTPYYSTLAVPTTTLALTDRLAIRYYVTHSGRTITLHTENNHLCQIITTFTTGLTALNGLTAQVQNFAVGTSGTDFNIASATATHTFNLPTASATNRGALSSADWSLFRQAYNDKINSASVTGTTTKTLTLVQQDGGEIQASWSDLNTDAVTSVFGRTGAVVAVSGDYNTSQVTESGNLYFTQARVSANTDVAANTAARHNAVTLGTANGLSLSTQQLSLGLASGSTTGALSSTDWNTFNNKQNALTLTTTGTSGVATLLGSILNIPNYGSALSGYVPYTGATSNVDLGIYTLSSSNLIANGGFNSGALFLKQSNNAQTINLDYTTITPIGTNQLNFGFSQSSGVWKSFVLNAINLTNNTNRTYTLPDASGTIALVGGSGVGTVTSVAALTLGTSGTDLSSTVANSTTTPVITLNVPTASATNRGALSAADWITFNNKQNSLTNPVTGTGTSGRIAYWNGTNSITSDGGLTWDDASNRLTIGLLSTNVPLVVSNGDVNSLVALLTGNNAARGLLIGTYNSGADDSGVTINAQHSSGQISLGTAGNQRVIISNDSVNFRHTTLAASSVYFDTTYQDAFTINSLGRLLVNKTDDNGARLQVTGDGRFSSSLTASSFIRTGGTSSQYLMADGSVSTLTNPVTGTGTTNYLPKFTGTSTIGNSQIFDNGSGVTINGTNVGERFNVNGYIGLQRSGTQIWHYGVDSSNSLEFLRSGIATRMILSSDGNLGLGVTPSAWASGFRAIQMTSGTSLMSHPSVPITYLSSNYLATDSGPRYIQNDGAARFIVNGWQSQFTWETAPSGTAGNAITFTQPMTLTSDGNLLVGTASNAGFRMSINGPDGTSYVKFTSTAAATGGRIGYNGNEMRIDQQENANLIFRTNGNTQLTISNTGAATFSSGIATNGYTASVSHAALFNGNVGIFTPSPRGRLAIRTQQSDTPSLLFQNDLGGPSSAISNYETAAQTYTAFGTNFYINSSASLTRFDTSKQSSAIIFDEGTLILATGPTSATASNRFSISPIGAATFSSSVTAGGQVSINAGNGNQLYLNNSGQRYTQINFDHNSSGSSKAGLWWDNTDNFFDLYAGSGGGLRILSGGIFGAPRMVITSGGNVLIGTTTDGGARMRVEGGELRVTTSNAGVALYNNSSSGEVAAYNWGGSAYIPLNLVGLDLKFNTSTTERMRIFSDGNVLIQSGGTFTNNGARLQVSGTAGAGITLRHSNGNVIALLEEFSGTQGGALTLRNSSGTNNIQFNAGGVSYINGGNVGIGIDIPTGNANRILHINGADSAEIHLTRSNSGTSSTFGGYVNFDGSNNFNLQNRTGGAINLITGTTNALTLAASTGAATFSGSLALPHTTKTANYTLTATDYTVGFDCASNRTATLPDATTCAGRVYVIYQYNTGSGVRSVTLDGNGSQTINGATTYSLSPYCDFTSVMIQSNGSNWIIISSNLTANCL